MIELLTGEINSGVLATTLRNEIARIGVLATDLAGEVTARENSEVTLSQAMADAQAGVAQALTFTADERNSRIDDKAAWAEALDLVAATAGQNLAAVQTTIQAEVSTIDGKVGTPSSQLTQAVATAADNLA